MKGGNPDIFTKKKILTKNIIKITQFPKLLHSHQKLLILTLPPINKLQTKFSQKLTTSVQLKMSNPQHSSGCGLRGAAGV
jgi:hypothetical protein